MVFSILFKFFINRIIFRVVENFISIFVRDLNFLLNCKILFFSYVIFYNEKVVIKGFVNYGLEVYIFFV